MADRSLWRKNLPEDFDGRFGEKFDDEVSTKAVVQISVGILVLCIFAVVICIGLLRYLEASAAERFDLPPSAMADANERWVPQGPLLQADPEGELEVLLHGMNERLGSYGWVDEGRGVAHIPIDKAIELVAAGHSPRPLDAAAVSGEGAVVSEVEGSDDADIAEESDTAEENAA